MSGETPFSVGPFEPGGEIAPEDLASMHLDVRQWQEEVGQNKFSNLHESQEDIGALEQHYIDEGGNFFIAREADGSVVGFVGLHNDGDGVGSIKRLAVLPDQQRRGIGRALVGELVDWARANDFRKLSLHTNKGENARPLYETFGFQVVGFLPDKGKYGDWVMELELNGD